jgi:uncharacterized protein (TIGR01777 family)
MENKLIIAGGNGFLGEVLINYFKNRFNEIIVLTRQNKASFNKHIQYIFWDGENLGDWCNSLENSDLLINLAGKSVDCRYNTKNKNAILNSRINSTNVLNQAVLNCANPPKHFIQSSTSTIYIHSENKLMTEENGDIGNDFSMSVAKQWEEVFLSVPKPKTISTIIRTSIVLGKNGGAMLPLKKITKIGLGGKQGNGQQWVSWIHEEDFARAIDFCYQNQLNGIYNIVAPNPVKNEQFMKEIRKNLNIKIGVNSPKWMLKIGAFFMQTEAELLLKSRYVYPEKLIKNGFGFKYPTLSMALEKLI